MALLLRREDSSYSFESSISAFGQSYGSKSNFIMHLTSVGNVSLYCINISIRGCFNKIG